MYKIDLEQLFRTSVRGGVMKRYKVVDKNRFYTFLTFLFIIIIISVYFLFSKNTALSSVQDIRFYEIKVVEGDNLWNIASNHLKEKKNMQRAIYDLKKFNNLKTSYIYPGDIIKIPISY